MLFVEDETTVLDTLLRFFEREGHQVWGASGLSEAVDQAARFPPDVVLLDVMLNEGPEPQHNGFEVCRALRERGYEGPVVFVTARTEEHDKLLGFDLGADDYVTKPFSLKELNARLSAVLRRAGGTRSLYRFGDVDLDLDNYVVRHGTNGEERLSNREQELLRYLVEHRGKVLSREELLTKIWKYSPNVTTRTVDTHVLNLRKKLRDDAGAPRFIETMHGVGYKWVAEEG